MFMGVRRRRKFLVLACRDARATPRVDTVRFLLSLTDYKYGKMYI